MALSLIHRMLTSTAATALPTRPTMAVQTPHRDGEHYGQSSPDAPEALDDSYTTNAGTPLTVAAPGILTNDTSVDGNTLSVSQTGDVSNGTLILNGDGSFTYTPDDVLSAMIPLPMLR